MPVWHTQSVEQVVQEVRSDLQAGLTPDEAASRLTQVGRNELSGQEGRSVWQMLWEQVRSTMVVILIVAAVISAFLGKWLEAGAILAIVVLFALLGFVQEMRAERAMAALKKLAVPTVRVRRGGQLQTLPAPELVPGDLVLLEAGSLVPADLRLTEAVTLRIQEAALTGEAEAIEKQTDALAQPDLPLGDRRNMAYMGTTVAYGRGAGLVVATGMATELGEIAALLESEGRELTPLQRRLDQAGKWLAVGGVLTALLVALLGLWRGQPWIEVFLTGVSVAVAVVPEGLPAVVTITLALGARRMLARRALIRRLPAVETLGAVTVICSDKTGTLTENRMTVTILDVGGHRIDLDEEVGAGGQAQMSDAAPAEELHPALQLLLMGGALCNDAQLVAAPEGEPQRLHAAGDPTEGALVIAAARFGLDKAALDAALPRQAELPFDSERKRMTTAHRPADQPPTVQMPPVPLPIAVQEGEWIAFTKGSVDGLLAVATHVWMDTEAVPLDDQYRTRIEESNRSLAQNGMRVLGVALRRVAAGEALSEQGLVFVGMVGIMGPPRPEVKEAVARCRTAGIRPVMITGDHPLTALHIARELGIATTGSAVRTGVELEQMDETALEAVVEEVSVYARVSPEHKLRIVEALRRRGHIVAMTGDGVNDAPALKHADIGVAMGITGTDVAKESAAMVLQDDNFATIVAAVEEGRTIFANLRKFIKFSIAGNIGKLMVMVLGVALGLPTPLLPLQLLWLNLLTDGLLGVGLGLEPAERTVMRRPPFAPQAGIFSEGLGAHIARMGVVIGALGLAMGLYHWWIGYDDWQTMTFTTLAFAQVWQAFAIRGGNEPFWRISLWSNRPLLGLALVVTGLQLAAIYTPWLQTFLATEPLAWGDLLLCAATGALVLVFSEVEKAWARRADSRRALPLGGPIPSR